METADGAESMVHMISHRSPRLVLEPEDGGTGGCHHICAFFGEFGFMVQFVLAFFSFSALIIKRFQETPRRPLKIFKLDALKNGLGASLAHFMNIFIALRLAGTADPCPWYLIQIVLDTTVVVFANFVMLRWFEGWLMTLWNLDVTSGDYGEPPDTRRWLQQLGVWFIVVFVCKVAFAFVLVAGHAQLSVIASIILSPLCFNPHLELFIVVVFLPLILNAFSFWMMDSFLKYTDDRGAHADPREGKRRRNTALTEAFGGHVDYGATGL